MDRFLLGIALACGLFASTIVGVRGVAKLKSDSTISVTGSAKRRIKSDLVIWNVKVSNHAPRLDAAYKALAVDVGKVTAWLDKKGVGKDRLKVLSVGITKQHPIDKLGHALEDVVSGYALEQSIEIRGADVEKIGELSRAVTELISDGIEVDSEEPQYIYTKLSDLKVKMLAEAAKDSRERADQIATSTGAHIGTLRQARMGVIQINPADSTETSNEGNNDTSALEKDIITVVASTFTLD